MKEKCCLNFVRIYLDVKESIPFFHLTIETYIYIYVIYICMLLNVSFLATRTKKRTVNDVATSTTCLLHGYGCCDYWR